MLADVEDVDALAEHVARLIAGAELSRQLSEGGLATVTRYDWPEIAARYYRELYLPLREAAVGSGR